MSAPALAAARAVAPSARAGSAAIERDRALPAALLRELADAGLMNMCLPASLGGMEAPPHDMIEAIAELARADAASAWCAMIASTSSLLGAYLAPATAARVFDGGRAITGGVFAPRGRAERTDEGFLVTGRWSFATGVGHCDWVMGGCVVQRGGRPELLDGGAPDVRLMLMPREHVEVIDTWSVSGLRGTGSHDIEVREQLVPLELGVSLFTDPPVVERPLYAFPLFGLLAVGIAAVSLGIARGAIEDLIALAAEKAPAGSTRSLALRPVIQAEVARAEARLRAARALMAEAAREAMGQAAAGASIPLASRLGLRLAATHATETSASVVTAMYHAGGGSSIYDSSPLQRRLRDVHVATQHMMVAPPTWELGGRLLLGLDTDTAQL